MKVSLDLRKSLEENATYYFDQAKKARGKIVGAEKAIEKAKVARDKTIGQEIIVEKQAPKKIRKKAWYEKFKWFWASNGMLVVAGRDATTNEILIKKYTDDHDFVFHTGTPGSPFVVLKTDGNKAEENIFQEAGDFCASHSKAWKLGLATAEVYWVKPEQVTKDAKAGEYMSKGSFMVYGKRSFVHPKIGLVAIPFEDKIMIAPVAAAQAYHQGVAAKVDQGRDKSSDAAKKVNLILGVGEPDDVLPGLPAGGCKITKMVLEKKTER